MLFIETKLKGAFIIELDRREDARGFFARAFCQEEFAAHGCNPVIAQANIGYNRYKGTLRGMHFQFPPAAETKLVRASRGAMFDVIVDLRPESPTYLQHVAVELSADNHRGIYIPERFAHGYQSLVDDTETTYQMGRVAHPRIRGWTTLRRSGARARVAAASDRDFGQGSAVEAACKCGGRAQGPDGARSGTEVPVILGFAPLREQPMEARPIRVGECGAAIMASHPPNRPAERSSET